VRPDLRREALVLVGRRQRQRERSGDSKAHGLRERAPSSEYRDSEGDVLALRGSLTPAARRDYAAALAAGADREDAWQRGVELLFERLAVSWTLAGLQITAPKELLGRYRLANTEERRFVRDSLRAHVTEHFPELQAP
jgi:hypothetical protein